MMVGKGISGKLRLAVALAFAGLMLLQTFTSFAALSGRQREDRPARAREPQPEEYPAVTRNDCSYLRDPESFRSALARHREAVSQATVTLSNSIAEQAEVALTAPQEIPRKNFIDNILFDRMARDNVMSAPLCTDAEFIRRAYLDLTGRIPSADVVTSFLSNQNANKRDALIDSLIGTPEFVDKWTMFFGDLFKNTARATNVNRFTGGRDAFYNYLKISLTANKSYAQLATEMLTAGIPAAADNFVNGEANFLVGGIIPMGPPQDTMDGTAVNTASMFLGINSLDCLFCHSGAGHLDNVNLWGAQRTREEAWGMAAFFARVRRQRQVLSTQPNYAKYLVSENNAGEYQLNTTTGNRQPREPVNGVSTVAPRFILNGAGASAGETRRQAIARLVTSDKQFARAAVNYIWEKIMVEALVSPSNAFDPARLDPNAQLPAGWSLQPANAELLDALATEFIRQNYNLRSLIALMTKSSAYQLSAQYPGNWSLALVPYYARKYVRRLDAEEIHDAILKATGIGVTYQLRDTPGNNTFTVNWAMQLPDTLEPRTSAAAAQFLNSFIRGDRDVKPRSLEPSIQQALNLMNHSFVMNRIHQTNTGSTVARLLADTSLSWQQIITQLYLNTLSRNPSQSELDKLLPLYTSMSKKDATEAIQWALLNKVDFIFNY
ncbi:MAG: DUF1553 domain-containing protein [Blastocatellia bacterium]